MKIGHLIIATNKYTRFLQPLIDSADKFFLKGHDVTYFIFTNQDDFQIKTNRNVVIIHIEHEEWPMITLLRYKFFSENSSLLEKMDYLYYTDADMLFIDDVGSEVLSERVVTQHMGYYGRRGTPETRPESTACVYSTEQMQYFAGGFNGGISKEFLKMSNILNKNIQIDYNKGIIAVWHDESHLNRYAIDNPPTKILDPGYCFVTGFGLPFKGRLEALKKNHQEIRN
jgi:histo-blood group ABO system transferase